MEYRDYYQALGVPRTASPAEIKKAYRRLARQHHPDLKPGDAAAERRFKEINEAHEVLSDPQKRQRYDALGANWDAYQRTGGRPGSDPFGAGGPFAGFGGPGGGNVRFEFSGDAGDFSDFFRTFFAGGMDGAAGPAGGAGTARGAGARARGRGRVLEDDEPGSAGGRSALDDLLAGLGIGGRGRGRGSAAAERGAASGTRAGGRPTASGGRPAATEAALEVTLEDAFSGATRLVEVGGKRLEVKIPAGVETGSRIRLRGKGGGTGDAARDLILVVRVAAHPVFAREGANLARELPITLREALLGAQVPVRTLRGRLLLTIPAGTQTGRTFRLAGQGMPRLRGEGRGELHVKVRVVLPTLDERGRAAAAAFLDQVHQPDPREPQR